MADTVEWLPERLRLRLKAHHYERILARDLLALDSDLRALSLLVQPRPQRDRCRRKHRGLESSPIAIGRKERQSMEL